MRPIVAISFIAPVTVNVLLEADEAVDEADATEADDAIVEEDGGAEVVAAEELATEDGGAEDDAAEDDAVDELFVVEATTTEDTTAEDVALPVPTENGADEDVTVAFAEDGGTTVPTSFIASIYTGLHWAPCEIS